MERGIEQTRNRIAEYDTIGPWSEIKLEIVQKYATAYSQVMVSQFHKGLPLYHVYIDAFAGSGVHMRRLSGEFVPGSPLNALLVEPPFREYFFIDLDSGKVQQLQKIIQQLFGERDDVHVYQGDCNEKLLREIFPKVRFEQYRRALCLLDPYGLHLDWQVIRKAGEMRSVEIFLNFPMMDMNRNVLWTRPDLVSPEQKSRMTRFWGDDSWQEVAYKLSPQLPLFGSPFRKKVDSEVIANAFRERLIKKAGFVYVPEPLPVRNTKGSILYYLFFASYKETGKKIVEDIFAKFRDVTPEVPKMGTD